MACLFSILIRMFDKALYVVSSLWFFLFFGAALISACTGVIVNSVPKSLQSSSSSFSQLIFDPGGYFLAPITSAYFMEFFDDKVRGLAWDTK